VTDVTDAVSCRTQMLLSRQKLMMPVTVRLLMSLLLLFLATDWSQTQWGSFRRRQAVRWIQRGAHHLFTSNCQQCIL